MATIPANEKMMLLGALTLVNAGLAAFTEKHQDNHKVVDALNNLQQVVQGIQNTITQL